MTSKSSLLLEKIAKFPTFVDKVFESKDYCGTSEVRKELAEMQRIYIEHSVDFDSGKETFVYRQLRMCEEYVCSRQSVLLHSEARQSIERAKETVEKFAEEENAEGQGGGEDDR